MKISAAVLLTLSLYSEGAEVKNYSSNLRGEDDSGRRASNSCCSWNPYCGDPVGDSSNWCSQSQIRCEGSCNGEWLSTCEAKELPGCCRSKQIPFERKPCWCNISENNCMSCDGAWSTDTSGCASVQTTTTAAATPTGCFNCANNNPCQNDPPTGGSYFTHCNPSVFIQCGAGPTCVEQPCAPGTTWDQSIKTCV